MNQARRKECYPCQNLVRQQRQASLHTPPPAPLHKLIIIDHVTMHCCSPCDGLCLDDVDAKRGFIQVHSVDPQVSFQLNTMI